MEFLYMGTAAAEGIPGMCCNCNVCQKALALGGKNVMTRSQALIDGELLVDFASDTYFHFLQAGKTMWDIENVLLTHSHSDHLTLEEFYSRYENTTASTAKYPKLKIYTSAGVIDMIRRTLEAKGAYGKWFDTYFDFIPMEYFQPVQVGAYTVTPFPAEHAKPEKAFIFLIERDGKSVFYGNDTGVFGEEVDEWLEKNKKHIDLLSLDCTKGDNPFTYTSHMSMAEGRAITDRFIKRGVVDGNTRLIYTHFSHNCRMVYDELKVVAKEKYGFEVAYDGMRVQL